MKAALNFAPFRIAAGNWDRPGGLAEPGTVDDSGRPWLRIHARNALIPRTVVIAAPGGGPGDVVAVTVGAAVVGVIVVVTDAAFDPPLLEHPARPITAIPTMTVTTSRCDILESDHTPNGTIKRTSVKWFAAADETKRGGQGQDIGAGNGIAVLFVVILSPTLALATAGRLVRRLAHRFRLPE
jgi:hypothetical protein